MPDIKEITRFLDDYLRTGDIDDTSWNGLQVEGKEKVEKVAFAVDAGVETFERSVEEKADMLVVHHGLFWTNRNPSISGWMLERVEILLENGISLYCSHLPLDRHEEVGHNAQILKLLGAKVEDEFLPFRGKNVGWTGRLKNPRTVAEIETKLSEGLGAECRTLAFGPEQVKTIAICTGGGGYGGFYEAMDAGVDLYITGDAVEVYYTAKDAGMNVIFAGHHATETIGLKALAKIVSGQFGVETVFIDLPTGL